MIPEHLSPNARELLVRIQAAKSGVTQQQLMQSSGFSQPVVSRGLEELLSAELIRAEREKPAGVGKPPLLYLPGAINDVRHHGILSADGLSLFVPVLHGMWLRTDPCVAERDCPRCAAERYEPCRGNGHLPVASVHYARKSKS